MISSSARFIIASLVLSFTPVASAQVACTMDAKMCPDGSYVGRTAPNCEFAACPGDTEIDCRPYVCADGTKIDRCSEDGHVINYFAAPCHNHGGEEGAPFSDVTAAHPNADAIYYVKAQGIVQGYEDGTYRPQNKINRAEFTKILMESITMDDRMCKIAPFADSVFGAWYETYVHAARCQGIVEGYSDGTFRPAADINFVEAAKIIVKAFGLEATTTIPACESGDCPWYRTYVLMLEAHGAIPTSIRSLDQQIKRGEMAEIIWRLKTGTKDLSSRSYLDLSGALMNTFETPAFRVRFPENYVIKNGMLHPEGGHDDDSLQIVVTDECPDVEHLQPTSRATPKQSFMFNGSLFYGNPWGEGAAGSAWEGMVYVYAYPVDGGKCLVAKTTIRTTPGSYTDDTSRLRDEARVIRLTEEFDAILNTIVLYLG